MFIYVISNMKNGKRYVGKTVRPIRVRWSQHLRQANCGARSHLHCAIRKYGPLAFRIRILCIAKSNEDANRLERFYISQFGTTDGRVGYNIMAGGDGVTPGFKFSAESRARMGPASWSSEGKKRVEKTQFKKGNVSPWTGKRLPAAVRRKISRTVSAGLIGNKRRLGIPHTKEMREYLGKNLRSQCGAGFAAMKAAHPDYKERASRTIKAFWKSLTPVARTEFIRKRAEIIAQSRKRARS